jgi:hypothetical protein
MPVSVARKVEFFIRRDGDDVDVRLIPIALTADQVDEFDLPRVPIKETDRRRAGFEEQHGEGACELDALEALHPGALARIVEEAIGRYREPARSLRRRIARKAGAVRREIEEATESVLARHAGAIDNVRTAWTATESEIAEHQQAIADAVAECRETIAVHEHAIETGLDRWRQDAEPVWREIARDLEAAAPDPSEIDWPRLKDAVEDDEPLYDSKRRYVQQMRHYKVRQGK